MIVIINAQNAIYLCITTALSNGINLCKNVSRRNVIKLRHMVMRIVENVNIITLAEPRVSVTPQPATCRNPDFSFRNVYTGNIEIY